MCNWSQAIEEMATERGIKKGIEKERLNAIEKMLRAGATKEQIILYGYTEEELLETEKAILHAKRGKNVEGLYNRQIDSRLDDKMWVWSCYLSD